MMVIRAASLFLLCFTFFSSVLCQSTTELDSVRSLLSSDLQDEEKLEVYYWLAAKLTSPRRKYGTVTWL